LSAWQAIWKRALFARPRKMRAAMPTPTNSVMAPTAISLRLDFFSPGESSSSSSPRSSAVSVA